jgi:hypothetical protein
VTQGQIDRTTETLCQSGPEPPVTADDVAPKSGRGGDAEPAEDGAGSPDNDEYEEL